MQDERYNGWANRATWLAALWIGNEEGVYNDVRDLARAAVDEDEDATDLAPRIESYMQDLAEAVCPGVIEGASFVSDLFGYALAFVDWQEIATGEIDEAREAVA